MAVQLRITVTETTDGVDKVIARFDYTDDAFMFAETITGRPSDPRTVRVTDRAGYINLVYENGFTVGLHPITGSAPAPAAD